MFILHPGVRVVNISPLRGSGANPGTHHAHEERPSMPQNDQPHAPRSVTVAAVQGRIRFFGEAADFRRQVSLDVERAMQADPDLILFPEDIGTGLVALGTPSASRARSLSGAMLAIGLRNIHRVLPMLARPSVSGPRALLLALADRMREVYVGTFSDLAADAGVHIAAGTALLPRTGSGQQHVHNTFFLFGPDGAIAGTADKVNLIGLEADGGLDLTPGASERLTVWHTPIGCFAPVICYDAWDEKLVRSLVAQGAQMLLVPAANPEPWDDRVIAERHEGMYSRVREFGVPGVEAFGVGELAGLHFEGRSWIVAPAPDAPDGIRVLARAESASRPEVISATVTLPPPGSGGASEIEGAPLSAS
jgi:predicted amidohydrolase